ncbi:MAG: hypothetical protein ACLP36_16240 [Acidimicrobiales bacterium]
MRLTNLRRKAAVAFASGLAVACGVLSIGIGTAAAATAPTFTISPAVGPIGGGTSVTVTATGSTDLSGATYALTEVQGGYQPVAPGTTLSCSNSTTCSFTTPAGGGLLNVTVTTNNSTSTGSATQVFAYQAAGPLWDVGQVASVRNSGSDTTIFLMQKLADLFNQAGLYGCTLQADNSTCNQGGDVSTTDHTDNFDRTEVTVGVDAVGSGNGLGQLCGTVADPSIFAVDFARSSKTPAVTGCTDLVGLGFALDAVPAIDFPTVDPSVWGTASAFSSVNSGNIGDVADGWIPGASNALNCGPLTTPCSGTPFLNMTNTGGASSVAYQIYCSHTITDWGQLTNLSGSETPGEGTPIGIPIFIVGVNPASGTYSTYNTFIQSSQGTSCNADTYAYKGRALIENDAAQLQDYLNTEYPNDPADQAVELGASIYFMSNGVYTTNSYAKQVTVCSTVACGTGSTSVSYAGQKMQENAITATSGTILADTYPTTRTLWNAYRTGTVRASTAGFLDWVCDSNVAFQKGRDNSTGKNYDTEITNLINTQFGFIRQSDANSSSCPMITSVENASS